MATMKSISRGSGQSAIASAAYRAGEKLQDARYGKVQDYSKKEGVLSKEIIFPSALKNQTSIDRNSLWNKAEEAEKRKDSRVAREWIVNLPHELNEQQRQQLAHEFSQKLADKYNVIADCCIHQPSDKEVARGADPRNFHAHIMLTTRQVHLTADGNIVLGEKAAIELSDKKRKSLGLERVSDEIVELRQLWEQTANTKLAEIGCELIDSRSYKERGLDIEPQIKMGKNATQLKRRTGKDTPVHEINTLIKERNAAASMVQELKLERERQEKQRKADEQQRIAEFNKQTERADTAIARSKQRIDEQQSEIKRAAELIERAARLIKQVKELDYRDIGRKFLEHAVAATEAPKNEYKDYQLAANELLKVYKPLSGDEVKRRFEANYYNNETQLVMPTSRQNTPLFSVYSCGLISVNTYELRDLTRGHLRIRTI